MNSVLLDRPQFDAAEANWVAVVSHFWGVMSTRSWFHSPAGLVASLPDG